MNAIDACVYITFHHQYHLMPLSYIDRGTYSSTNFNFFPSLCLFLTFDKLATPFIELCNLSNLCLNYKLSPAILTHSFLISSFLRLFCFAQPESFCAVYYHCVVVFSTHNNGV